MSSLATLEVPLKPKSTRYQPKVNARRCLTCQHPEREAIDYALTLGQRPYSDIGKEYGLTIANLYQHKRNHLSTAIKEAVDEYGIVNIKEVIQRIKVRSERAHNRYLEADSVGHGRLAAEHDTILIKATGNWKESREIDIHGSIQLTAADKADADYLDYLREYPIDEPGRDRLAHYMAWAERRLMGEVAPAMLTTDSVQGQISSLGGSVVQGDRVARAIAAEACTDGDT